jgi:hypothetical protein
MKKYPKVDGFYIIDDQKYKLLTGSRAQVWHSTAYKTTGGLVKEDLLKNKHGEIVSKKKHEQESKDSNLIKHGYGFVPGVFGYEKIKGVVPPTSTVRSKRSMSSTRKSPRSSASMLPPIMSPQQGGFNVQDNTIYGLASTAAPVGGARKGGRRGTRRRKMRGGSGQSPLSPDTLYGGNKTRSRTSMLAGGYSGTSPLFL